MPFRSLSLWRDLDPDGPPSVVWARDAAAQRVCVLLGAFDPPTNAHLDVLRAAAEATSCVPALGLTKVRLARSGAVLWDDDRRLEVLEEIAERCGFGLLLANRGTYLDVHRSLRAAACDPVFVVGADKLAQLADPSFYTDGHGDGRDGVDATFDEVSFVVIPRTGSGVTREDVQILDPDVVFSHADHAGLSATDIRRMIAEGRDVSGLVPPEVAARIGGYTSAR